MIDFGFDKLALIGVVALVVIGPEKLPRVARTVGTMMGKARRYVADVKAEVNRSIELEELQKMKSQFETAASDVKESVGRDLNEAQSAIDDELRDISGSYDKLGSTDSPESVYHGGWGYKPPRKNWRIKRAVLPRWFKQRSNVRGHVQSGAARVARHRPSGLKKA